MIDCRVKNIVELCNCIPYFYPYFRMKQFGCTRNEKKLNQLIFISPPIQIWRNMLTSANVILQTYSVWDKYWPKSPAQIHRMFHLIPDIRPEIQLESHAIVNQDVVKLWDSCCQTKVIDHGKSIVSPSNVEIWIQNNSIELGIISRPNAEILRRKCRCSKVRLRYFQSNFESFFRSLFS